MAKYLFAVLLLVLAVPISVFAFQGAVQLDQVVPLFVDEVEGEIGSWDWPARDKDSFRYDIVLSGHNFQVLVTYFLHDGGARIERADVVLDVRNLTGENYRQVANEVIESVYRLFNKAKAMEERGELLAGDTFITPTEQELELWRKLLSAGQQTYPAERNKLLNLDSDFVKINQIFGFFEGKRMIKVLIVVLSEQGLEEFHSILNVPFEELAGYSDEDFIGVARRAYEASESFLRARKLKIAD